jgi:phosphoribosyl-AMP cyclohydrolase
MLELHYKENGLIPVVVQDNATREVLMVAYANPEAVNLTRKTGFAHYYSRSRKKLWKKGEESGHFQRVFRILVDCDEDCLLYLVDQTGAACHTGYRSCFYRTLEGEITGDLVFDPSKVYANKEE